jgi:hypothetical protein
MLFQHYGANDLRWYIDPATGIFVQDTGTYSAGDWRHFVLTADYGNNDFNLYVDGVLVDTDNTNVGSGPTVSEWSVGSGYAGGNQSNVAIGELGLLDSILTAEEVSALYQRNAPLVDYGAFDTPGIYILDGRFKIASSRTGNRIEIDADEIAGYNSAGTKQFYLQASTGKAYAGGGAVTLDAGGITITEGTGTTNSIEWDDSSGNKLSDLHTEWAGGASDDILTELRTTQNNVSARNTIVRLRAYSGSVNVDFEVNDNKTINATYVTDFILNDGTDNWLDFGSAQDCTLILGDHGGSYNFIVYDDSSNIMFLVDSDGEVKITGGLRVGSTGAATDDDIVCDGTIATNSGEEWNLGGTASGTITADTKIHVQIDGSWYTIAAEAGLV